MTLAEQIENLRQRGFRQEQVEAIVLMQEAAIALFRAWPESFILYGGANLILFHNSVRHSSDLDLLLRSEELPSASALSEVLSKELEPLVKLLNLGQMNTRILTEMPTALKVGVVTADGRTLFTVDLSRIGSVINTEIQEHPIKAVAAPEGAVIKAVSRDYLLLQKAEAFMYRRIVKARDAYDIRLLLQSGASLAGNLKEHLHDSLELREIESQDIQNRIASVTEDLCRAELKSFLPKKIYEPLAEAGFQPLRDSLSELFEEWL